MVCFLDLMFSGVDGSAALGDDWQQPDEVCRFAPLPRTVYLVNCIQISDLVILSQRINFQISDLVIRVIAGDPVLECIWDDPRPSTINTGPIIDGIIQV